MKMKTRILSLFTTACITVTLLGTYSASSVTIAENKLGTKITEDLQVILDKSKDDDMIPVYIWTNDIDYNTVERNTIQASGFSKDTLMEKSNKIYEPLYEKLAFDGIAEVDTQRSSAMTLFDSCKKTANITKTETLSMMQDFYSAHKAELTELADDVDLYVNTRRSVARESYNKQNSGFSESYLKNAKIIFQSKYAPMIICEIPKSAILYLDSLETVDSLSLYEDIKCVDMGSVDTGVTSISGDTVRDGYFLDGEGVTVGQIEKYLPNTQIAELSNTTIYQDRNAYPYADNHASLVAAIIAGSTGMAPKANLCSTAGESVNAFFNNVEWLLKSAVNVINMSAGFDQNDFPGNSYNSMSRWVDHIVYQHNISWVNSAGNDGVNAFVACPANAYNVITVGGINDNGTTYASDDTFYTATSCTTGQSMPSKPDVLAPAVGLSLSNGYTGSGTSFAAPYVTGMIVQMIQFYPLLMIYPDTVKAAVIASCDRKVSGESVGEITNKEGAGVVDAFKAYISVGNIKNEQTIYKTSDKKITFDFIPKVGGTKTVAISWLKHVEGYDPDHPSDNMLSFGFSDFDLYVFDSNGNEKACSTFSYNSVEMVTFSALGNHKYTIEIRRYSSGTSTERISLAHT